MSDVSSSIRNDMINAAVNAMYSNVGGDSVKASEAARRTLDFNRNGRVEKWEMKEALQKDRVVLSLREHNDGSFFGGIRRGLNARDVARQVADRMDGADGRRDGYVDFTSKNGSGLFERLGAWLGSIRNGISTSDLTDKLANGDLVIGRQIRERSSARSRGFDIVELHQNKDGPKITSGR